MSKKIPIDVSSFRKLRNKNYIYVDKTRFIYDLITGGMLYFLSRPRRFGKSLLVSTFLELFEGNRELFKDLWIDKHTAYTWPVHPVIHLDFSTMPIKSGADLEQHLSWKLEEVANKHGFSVLTAPALASKLEVLFSTLAKKNGVVLLIDEYDYPLINNIENKEIALENHAVLRSFYSSIKGLDAHIEFLFITGVTKFAKTSIFSGMNNLNDISLDERAASLLGYTQEEVHSYFANEIENLACKSQLSLDQTNQRLKDWYDGYRFSKKPLYVYNPLSVLYCMHKQEFANYWIETGASAFLISLLKKHQGELEDYKDVELMSESFGAFEVGEEPLIPILFQAGYLTIAHHHENSEGTDLYTLRYPNREVVEAFKKFILAAHARTSSRDQHPYLKI
jgi:Predicted AAA-ATPase